MSPESKLTSQKILDLQFSLDEGNYQALTSFWNEVEKCGAPLIEEIESDPEHVLVTFVWKGDGNTRTVNVLCAFVQDGGEMNRLNNTDLWYKSCVLDKDITTAYLFALNGPHEPMTGDNFVEWVKAGLFRLDPYNLHPLVGENAQFPGESLLKLPSASEDYWSRKQDHVPAGKVTRYSIKDSHYDVERSVWVYRPADFTKDGYPLLVFLDGGAYMDLGVPVILDNLIAAGKIPPLVAVFLANVSHATRHLDCSCNPVFVDYLTENLIPWLQTNHRASPDPRQVAICGDSYTALCATYAAFRRPNVFGNVLAQSAPYFWYQGMDCAPIPGEDLEPDWLIRQFVHSQKLDLRFHIDVGSLETSFDPQNKSHTSILVSNRHMCNVLLAKGYEVDYTEVRGGHDFANWRSVLPRGIIFLLNTNRL
jgi:enterochelin esterase-like enzyme